MKRRAKVSPPPSLVRSCGADEVRDELEYQATQIRGGIADLGQRLDELLAEVRAIRVLLGSRAPK